ncbi:molybdenum ABC transporter ATP-binding protein [Methylococcus sp. EFPC2]|uniref:molybdenum ABC transporter ATP-binding protein n=1 Tax=Methylococcus sp. EFPC2 TaxID=2812648 RepID=UPI001966D209|nr:ATP-binding cassette domain-containing protein [Methylococcus sp. EFPC2]QSA99302.1 ATP-binding cassette domain-containing protein [Methylococcus sp. EFPC2]
MLEMDVKLSLDRFNLSATLALDSPMTAFFGPAGAGKSTLLGMIAGTVHPQRGWIKFGGEILFDTRSGIRVPSGRRRVGLVSRDPTIYPRYEVKAHLQDAYAQSPDREACRFDEIVHLLDLESLLDCHSQQLSVDEKRRVAVAHALMAAPRLLLVDDQPNAADYARSARILPYLTRVRDELNIPVIYVSYTLGDILQLTDHMVLIANGQVLGVGDVHDIIADRLLWASSALRGIENILPVSILDHEPENGCTLAYYYGTELVLPIAPHLPRNAATQIAVRSSDIALSRHYLTGTSIQNQIKGRVCAIIRAADHAVVQIDCGNTLLAGVSLRGLKDMDLQEGDKVYCLIKSHAFSYVAETVPASLSLGSQTRH